MKCIFFLVRNLFFQCISFDTDLKNRFLRRKKIFSYACFLLMNKSINDKMNSVIYDGYCYSYFSFKISPNRNNISCFKDNCLEQVVNQQLGEQLLLFNLSQAAKTAPTENQIYAKLKLLDTIIEMKENTKMAVIISIVPLSI